MSRSRGDGFIMWVFVDGDELIDRYAGDKFTSRHGTHYKLYCLVLLWEWLLMVMNSLGGMLVIDSLVDTGQALFFSWTVLWIVNILQDKNQLKDHFLVVNLWLWNMLLSLFAV